MTIFGKLAALKVAREKRAGRYGDSGGLYLQITARGVNRRPNLIQSIRRSKLHAETQSIRA